MTQTICGMTFEQYVDFHCEFLAMSLTGDSTDEDTIAFLAAGASNLVTVNATPVPGTTADITADATAAAASPDESDPDLINNDAQLTIGHVVDTTPFAEPIFTTSGLDFAAGKALPSSEPPGLQKKKNT